MTGNRVYDFHQQEIDDLKSAAVYTCAVCDNLKRMLEGIRDDQPHWAARAISELLDPNYQCKSYVYKVDQLLAPVSVPVNVPRRTKMHRGPDGIHYEKKFPLVIEMREEPLAHLAACVIRDTVVTYLWSVWRRGNPTWVCCDATTATDELVGPRWQEIRSELQAFINYDCDGLRQAVKAESKAAMERCRQSIVGDAPATLEPPVNAGVSLVDSAADDLDKACQEALKSALQAHKIRTEVAATLTLEQRRNIIMAHWDCTPSKTRDKWLESKWKPLLGKQGKTALADKVKVCIKRGKKKLAELATEE